MRRIGWLLAPIAVALCACGTGPPPAQVTGQPHASAPASGRTGPTAPAIPATTSPGPSAGARPPGNPAAPPALPAARGGGPARFPPTSAGPLSGEVVVVDPGHNGGNAEAPSVINRLIWNGRETETCDTTGTQTAGGYPEALFNWNVARYLTADLRAQGATVVLTRTTDTGVGPCVTRRAAIGNEARAGAAVSIHADAGPPGGRGFAILEPVADGINNAITAPSAALGADLRDAFTAGTGEPVSSYDGIAGIQPRDDLAGTNLSTVPKVFIECVNLRNATDAALATSPGWQATAARAIAAGLAAFLSRLNV